MTAWDRRRLLRWPAGSDRWRASPAVSVVINTIDRRDYLAKALDGLRDSKYANLEVLVVNGPSRDGTAEFLKSVAGIRVLDCPEPRLGLSRNIGVSAAAGDVIAFLDDDAVPEPDWLSRVAAAYAEPGVSGVGGPVFDIPTDRVLWKVCTCTRSGVANTDTDGDPRDFVSPGSDPFLYLAGCSMTFSREALREVEGFNEDLAYGYEDVEVSRRLIDAGHQLRYEPTALVRHERAPSSTRNEDRELTDVASLIRARAVFALQGRDPHGGALASDDIRAELAGWVEALVADGQARHASGRMTAVDLSDYASRASAALADGLVAAAGPRPGVQIPRVRRRAFQRLRDFAPTDRHGTADRT